MEIKKIHWIAIGAASVSIILDLIFFLSQTNLFFFVLGFSLVVAALPFVANIIFENKREDEVNERFLEFARNLAESVTTGTPISKSIVNMSQKDYGPLSPHIRKLANQIYLGIPVNKAFESFSYDVGSPVISRAVGLIREAERAGGDIDFILDSVASSISEVEKLKKERKAAISNLVVQGYIIFFIFIGIMLVMEFKILPLISGSGGMASLGGFSNVNNLVSSAALTSGASPVNMALPFLFLLLAQGFFTGLTIGKLAEGNLKAGVKHSFIMVVSALLISTGARLILS